MNRERDGGSSTGEKKRRGGEGERARPVLHLSTHLIAALSGAIAVLLLVWAFETEAGEEAIIAPVELVEKASDPQPSDPISARIPPEMRRITVEVEGADWVEEGDRMDLTMVFDREPGGFAKAVTRIKGVLVLAAGPTTESGQARRLSLAVSPELDEDIVLADSLGILRVTLRHPGDDDTTYEGGITTFHTVRAVERIEALLKIRREHQDLDPERLAEGEDRLSADIPPDMRAVQIPVSAGLEGVRPLDRVDVIGVMISPFCDLPVAQRLVDDVRVMAVEAGAGDSGALLLSVLLEEAELLHFAASIGELHLLLSNPEAEALSGRLRDFASEHELFTGDRERRRVSGGRPWGHARGLTARGEQTDESSTQRGDPCDPLEPEVTGTVRIH